MDNLIVPVVNLNGTLVDELITQRHDVADALRHAIGLLEIAAPHARDFQTAGAPLYRDALTQHEMRERALTEVLQAIVAETEALYDQKLEREAQRKR